MDAPLFQLWLSVVYVNFNSIYEYNAVYLTQKYDASLNISRITVSLYLSKF